MIGPAPCSNCRVLLVSTDHRTWHEPGTEGHTCMNEPEFDADGYPTDATLERIEKWPIAQVEDAVAVLEFVQRAWLYPDWFTKMPRRHRDRPKGPLIRRWLVSTGGWSGNESLIGAMAENHVLWMLIFEEHRRGGHYKFLTQ